VVREVVTALAVAGARGAPLVVFNARYDLTVLDRECRRYGLPPLQERQFELLVIDPLVIDKWLDRYRKGSRKLEAICAHYGAVLGEAHDADFDALAAARLAWCIGAKGQVVRKVWNAEMGRELAGLKREWEAARGDLARLHRAQRVWAAEQAMGLAQYFREQGQHEDAEGVRTEWPLIPTT
jgi:DNA polymerase-3 subunit epsilon